MRVCRLCGLLSPTVCDGCGRPYCAECMSQLRVVVVGPAGYAIPLVCERFCDRCMVRRHAGRRPAAAIAARGPWLM